MNKIIVYKLFKIRKNGSLGSLFINRKQILPIGKWIKAQKCPTKGYKFRPGWHCCKEPFAPHLSTKGRCWYLVEIKDFKTFDRPISQGGQWYVGRYMKIIKKIGDVR